MVNRKKWRLKSSAITVLNTQQMPSKRPEIRKMFYPGEGRIFVGMDQSQIELRVIAHLAQEEVLIDAFLNGKDIHSTTASQVFDIPYEKIEERKDVEGSEEQKARKNAKPVNFGLTYGLTAYGLSNQLNIPEKEAQGIIDAFYLSYPGIAKFMRDQRAKARKNGYVTDMFGRKRRLRADYKKGFAGSADRMAGNFPIQASAGGILKKAIVDLLPLLTQHDVNIALQIHDEILFDMPADIPRKTVEAINAVIENAVEIAVPTPSDVEISPDYWMQNFSTDEWFANNEGSTSE